MQHHYGENFHLLESATMNGLLGRLCSPEVFQPEINRIVQVLYNHLIHSVIDKEFATLTVTQETRMTDHHSDCKLELKKIHPDQKAVVVNLARAGTLPSHICYDFLHNVLRPNFIRQDHIFAARMTDSADKVTGTNLGAVKIGGDVAESFVLIPDPMGATGNTIVSTVNHYKALPAKPAKKYIALHLIVTPEYLRNLKKHHPEVQVYALRLDRGLSPKAILNTPLGLHWDQEKGLNDKDYIVPGGGGFGEIMNNSFV